MKIVMIGAGYVGLTTSVCLADFGNHVTCVDIDPQRVDALQRGELPIYEPGLGAASTAAVTALPFLSVFAGDAGAPSRQASCRCRR